MNPLIVLKPTFDEYVAQFKARRKELPTNSPSAIALRIVSIYKSEGVDITSYYFMLKEKKRLFK